MGLSHFSVARPVTIIMIYLAIVLLGIICLGRLPQELFPPLNYPQLTIVTTYENAAPEEVETQITKIVEEAIGTVSRLRRISSISKEGTSIVFAEFIWGTNLDFASLSLREKIDLVKERLPQDAEEPLVKKFNPFELPVLTLSVIGPMNLSRLREITERYIKDEVEKIEGVASASVVGGVERELLVEVNQDKLQACGLSVLDISRAIGEANINYPAGTIKESFTEYLVRTLGEFQTVPEIEKISVGLDDRNKEEGNYPRYTKKAKEFFMLEENQREEKRLILLGDVAVVKDTLKEVSSISRFNGKENISVQIQKQAMANTLDVVGKVKRALTEIKTRLPRGVIVQVSYDQSVFIKEAITGVTDAAWQGGLLSFLVLLFFLRDVVSSLIVSMAIPLSVLPCLILMFFSGISVNIMSLGGLALGIGRLVDDAIVVTENIFRHQHMGDDIKTASAVGAWEVAAAISSSTLTTITVFLPLVFVVGVAGQIFTQLSMTIAYALLASLFSAMTIIPVMTSKLTKPPKIGPDGVAIDKTKTKFFLSMEHFYGKLVDKFLARPWLYIGLVFILFSASMLLFGVIDKEFMTPIDQGQFIIKIDMQTGTVLESTNKVASLIEQELLKIPEIDAVSLNIGSTKGKIGEEAIESLGSHQAQMMINLKKERKLSSSDVIQVIKKRIRGFDLNHANVEYVLQESIFKSAMMETKPVVIEIKGLDFSVLQNLSRQVERQLGDIDGLFGVQTSLAPPSPETKVNIIKDSASAYEISVNDIAQTTHLAIKGITVSKFKEKGKEFDIRVRLREKDRESLSKLRQLTIHSPLGINVPLSMVSYLAVGKGPSQIKRVDQERVIVVSANIYQRPLNKVIEDITVMIAKMRIPDGYKVGLGGESKQMEESFKSLMFALILSFVLIYMIMASMFESLWQPFVIMFTVPMSMIGVAIVLYITHTSLNIISLLGVIILGGMVVNNGIVLIDFVNAARKDGMGLEEALAYGSRVRLRPIIMTALTTILGLLPLALGLGEGAKLQQPMAITIMGGMTVATFLTLVLIPAIYLVTQRFLNSLKRAK